jgi:RNA polymerase sigma factor (sigma-70 family)
MATYRLKAIGELAHQLTLSPQRLRPAQIQQTEYLLDLIEPDKSYPYEFVCYHVTGYRARRTNGNATLDGKHLIDDLILLVEELSGKPLLGANVVPDAVWTTEQLARRLNVSTKTICRWRRRGLPGRKLRFDDGTVRLAFAERAIRRFVTRHSALVKRGAAFKQLSDDEKQHIIDRARELLAEKRIRLHELSQTIAAETGRAVETVRYTLRRFDDDHPAEALFTRNEQPIVRPEHQALYDAYEAGVPIRRLARRFKHSIAAVEQIIREIRCRQLQARPLECIYNHEFDAPNADAIILANPIDEEDDDVSRRTDDSDLPTTTAAPRDLPPYLQDLYREALLTPKQERDLFRRYNYLKFKAHRLRVKLDPLHVTEAQLREISGLIEAAEEIKNRVIRANLRLVVSIARRHVGRAPEFLEIVSDGNMTLMRAVEKFDYARGYKFSTYASWAIMRSYARTIPETLYHAGRPVTSSDELLETVPDGREPEPDPVELEGVRQSLARGLSELDDRERAVVVQHFGLNSRGHAQTLDEIGRAFGVTKERIRQIERKAIKKLRAVLREEDFASALETG